MTNLKNALILILVFSNLYIYHKYSNAIDKLHFEKELRLKLGTALYFDVYEGLNLFASKKTKEGLIHFYKLGFPLSEKDGGGQDLIVTYEKNFPEKSISLNNVFKPNNTIYIRSIPLLENSIRKNESKKKN
ncbi:MAG: hypothetical protein NXH75_06655 [Halobacteriovoraceae bacterium]|nr:hypothetical protein [Halobacteriovoraceae bacterium]